MGSWVPIVHRSATPRATLGGVSDPDCQPRRLAVECVFELLCLVWMLQKRERRASDDVQSHDLTVDHRSPAASRLPCPALS